LIKSVKEHQELRDKILNGLEKSNAQLVEEKKKKNGELVVLKDNKTVKTEP